MKKVILDDPSVNSGNLLWDDSLSLGSSFLYL